MSRIRDFVPLVAVAVVACSLGFAMHATSAGGLAPRPTVVATIDIPRVLNSLDQRVDAQAKLDELAQEFQAEGEKREAEAKAAVEAARALKDLPRSDPKRRDAEEKARRVVSQFEAWQRYTLDRGDAEKSLLMRDLHRAVKRELAKLCEIEGYDIVLANDSAREISVNVESNVSQESQVSQQITAQRVVFAGPTTDVTDALVARMNNAYANSKGG